MTDRELLAACRARSSPEAFAELVRRYTDLVYSVALRTLDDPHAAEDATQATFVVLWRKGRSLKPEIPLAGWLFRTARTTALYLRRSGRTRARHEQEKAAMPPPSTEESRWEQLRPHLDAAVDALPGAERETVILRYLHGRSHAEIARDLDCPEGTVRTRLTAGLQRLRGRLQIRGILVPTVTALGELLSEGARVAAPAGLAAGVQAACLGAGAGAIHALAEGVMNTLFWAKVKLTAALLTVTALVGVSGASLVLEESKPPVQVEKPGGSLTFTLVPGTENGTAESFAQWKIKILEKGGGKLGSHDWWWWGLSVIDYDEDGDLDLVASVHGPHHGLLFKSQWKETGKLTFVNVTGDLGAEFLVPGTNWNPVVWDINGDGRLDIWGTGHDSAVTSLLNEGGTRFVVSSFKSAIYNNPKIQDLNGDGWPDAWHVKGGKRQEMLSQDQGRNFKPRDLPDEPPAGTPEAVLAEARELTEKFPRGFSPNYHRNVDLNGDGLKDAVLYSFGGYSVGPCMGRYLLADSTGKLADRTSELGLPSNGTPVLIQDLTGDGALDILIVADAAAGLYVNDGKGRFALQPGPLSDRVKRRLPYVYRAFPADLRNSGRTDLVLSARRGETQHVFENLGGGEFREVAQSKAWIDGVALGDMNNDGLLDVCVGTGNEIAVYLNRTPDPGNYCDLYPRMEKPNLYAAGGRVEVFRAGDLGKKDARPFVLEPAHPDGTPVHVGLGSAGEFDLRVTFPGSDPKVVELRGVQAKKRLRITPDGKLEELK